MKVSKRAATLKPSSTLVISAAAKKMKQNGEDIVSFTAGEPDFDTPDNIKEAGIKAIKDGFTKYTPSSGIEPLREAIAEKLKTDNGLDYNFSQIVVSNGGKHALSNTFFAILDDGDEVIIPTPYWLSYPEMVTIATGVPVFAESLKENGYKITCEQLEKVLTKKTKAIIINSPNNPSGSVYSKEELTKIGEFAVKNDLLIISDEIYEYLLYEDNAKNVSIASISEEIKDRTIIVNGLSKSYSMTGWRMGYTACNPEIAKAIANIQSHCASNPNSIAQMAALEALRGGKDSIDKMRESFKERMNLMYEEISKIPQLSALKPEGAFYVFIDASKLLHKTVCGKNVETAVDLSELILEKAKVAVIPCNDFGCPEHIRLTFSISIPDIKKGISRIKDFIDENY